MPKTILIDPTCKHNKGIQQKMGGVICNKCRVVLYIGTINEYLIMKAKEDKNNGGRK